MFKCEWNITEYKTSDVRSNNDTLCLKSQLLKCKWHSILQYWPLPGFISDMLNITPCKAVVWPFSLLEQSWRTTDCKFWNDFMFKINTVQAVKHSWWNWDWQWRALLHWKGRGYTPENVACWNRTGEGVWN